MGRYACGLPWGARLVRRYEFKIFLNEKKCYKELRTSLCYCLAYGANMVTVGKGCCEITYLTWILSSFSSSLIRVPRSRKLFPIPERISTGKLQHIFSRYKVIILFSCRQFSHFSRQISSLMHILSHWKFLWTVLPGFPGIIPYFYVILHQFSIILHFNGKGNLLFPLISNYSSNLLFFQKLFYKVFFLVVCGLWQK